MSGYFIRVRLRRRFHLLLSRNEHLLYAYLICQAVGLMAVEGLVAVRDLLVYLVFQTDCGIIVLPPHSHESYAKWRLLNPDGVFWHHTNVIQIKNVLVLLRYITPSCAAYRWGPLRPPLSFCSWPPCRASICATSTC